MPHVSSVSGAGDDLGSTDEVKVFKDEGEDEKRSSENLTEDKTSLIDLTESQEKSVSPNYTSSKNTSRSDLSPVFGKSSEVYAFFSFIFQKYYYLYATI
ncbi:protein pangolin, isoforms A/H/I/S-like isoform X3 [Diaphorina citri]|uniref:Protein pangolin, isoforms A/H/I/S-like isoform X3 n=1 Tax=Diaphorina citri TaxID=121845 RepID=A0A1S3DMK3_DIACI|nr:protein pangolin, isoforms A/H/I/S-like isoform X3 [Diaphorina citri]